MPTTIQLLPSNDRFQHATGPGGKCQDGVGLALATWSVAERVRDDGQDTQLRPATADVGALGVSCPITLWSRTSSVGHQVARPHGLDDVADGVQDQLGLLVLDVVAALGGDDQPAAGDQPG